MKRFEYKVVPAPRKGQKAKGVRSNEARFAHAMENLLNELGADGWAYQRTDTLPVEERQGLTGKTTRFQHMLVFRRALVSDQGDANPVALPAPQDDPSEEADESAHSDAESAVPEGDAEEKSEATS